MGGMGCGQQLEQVVEEQHAPLRAVDGNRVDALCQQANSFVAFFFKPGPEHVGRQSPKYLHVGGHSPTPFCVRCAAIAQSTWITRLPTTPDAM